MGIFSQKYEGKLQCPYKGCEKHFDKPTVITDNSTIPRQTHYACPFCMSHIDILTQNAKVIGIRAKEYPIVFDSPAKCAYYNGLPNSPLDSVLTQDECLICPKLLQCTHRKR